MSDDLLVSTVNGLYLIREGRVRRLRDGNYYGITWDRDRLYLACRSDARLYAWDGAGEPETVECPWRQNDVHQLLWRHGVLYVTTSGSDQIDAWDGSGWQTLWHGAGDGSDHVNSLWHRFDAFWVVEHRFGQDPAHIRVYGETFDQLRDTHEFQGLTQAHNCGLHNVYVEDARLFTLSVDRLIIRDLVDGTEGAWALGGYLRGLARTEGYHWYVGQSRVTERKRRTDGNAEVLVLDNRFRVLTRISIPGAGQVHDIRALRGDWAHNGLPCPVELA